MRIGQLFVAALTACAAFAAAPAWAQDGRWRRAETENFIVYYDGSERKLIEAARTLEHFHFTLAALTNAPADSAPQSKLEVYLVRGPQALDTVAPRISERALGFYDTSTEAIGAFLIYDETWTISAQEVLQHEYAHHFLLHRFPAAYPRWYIEGWAEFVSTVTIEDGRAIVGNAGDRARYTLATETTGLIRSGYTARLDGRNLLPIEQLLAPERTPETVSREREWGNSFYVHSWLATSFLANRPERNAGFLRYVRGLGEGGDPIASFEPAFGITPAAFDNEIREYLRAGTTGRSAVRLPTEPPAVTVTRLPDSMDDLLLPLARLRLGIQLNDEPNGLIQEVLRNARRFPTDAAAQRAAARVEILSEDLPAARTRLEGLVQANPNDAEALFLLGATHFVAAEKATDPAAAAASLVEARRPLARAFRADPNHYGTLYLYALTFAGGAQPLNEAQLNVLGRALELAPQAAPIRIAFAHELMEAQNYDEAVETLRPLLYAPHHEYYSRRARVLFDAAQRHEPPPAAMEDEPEEEAED